MVWSKELGSKSFQGEGFVTRESHSILSWRIFVKARKRELWKVLLNRTVMMRRTLWYSKRKWWRVLTLTVPMSQRSWQACLGLISGKFSLHAMLSYTRLRWMGLVSILFAALPPNATWICEVEFLCVFANIPGEARKILESFGANLYLSWIIKFHWQVVIRTQSVPFKHMCFWCQFLDLHLNSCHSDTGVWLR